MEIKNKPQSFLVLNNIRSAENVGACFRICDSCNVSLFLQGITPHPKIEGDTRLPYVCDSDLKKITKTATESINNVEFVYKEKPQEVIDYLALRNVCIYCLETNIKKSKNILTLNSVYKPFALVVGNENNGIEKCYLDKCEETFFIPMFGKNNSLNVAVSSAVALYKLISL